MGGVFTRQVKTNEDGLREFLQMQSDLDNLDEEHYVLNVEVVEANSLLSMDSNGLSDPYCKIEHSGVVTQTPIKFKTLTPKWEYQTRFIEDQDHALVVTVWDNDMIGTDDFIGEVEPEIPALGRCTDRWYKLKNPEVENVGNIRIRVIREWGGGGYWVNSLWDEILCAKDGVCPRQIRDNPEPIRENPMSVGENPVSIGENLGADGESLGDENGEEKTAARTPSWFRAHQNANGTGKEEVINASLNNSIEEGNGGNIANAAVTTIANSAHTQPRGSKGSLSTEVGSAVEAFTANSDRENSENTDDPIISPNVPSHATLDELDDNVAFDEEDDTIVNLITAARVLQDSSTVDDTSTVVPGLVLLA